MSKRKYVFKMPKTDPCVISLMSGGLDTTVVTAILMKEFNLQVYPIYFNRNIEHSKKTRKSVEFYTKYFLKAYPHQFHHPINIQVVIPPNEISKILFMTDSGETKIKRESQQRRGIPFQPSVYAHNAVLYAQYLQESRSTYIRNIFGGWIVQNGNWYSYETLTAIRAVMLDLCIMTKDYSWQFSSLPLEKELGFFWSKDTLITWGYENDIPLEYTWSCIYGERAQCGNCVNCVIRRKSFLEAKVEDKTKYLSPTPLVLSSRV